MKHWDVALGNINFNSFLLGIEGNYQWNHMMASGASIRYTRTTQYGFPIQIAQLREDITVVLATSFPSYNDMSFKIFNPIDYDSWIAIFMSLMVVALTFMFVMFHYGRFMPKRCNCKGDGQEIWFRVIGGATEAMRNGFFKFGIAACTVSMTFELLSFFLIFLYNINLRAYIIGEVERKDSYNDVITMNAKYDKVIFTLGGFNYHKITGV